MSDRKILQLYFLELNLVNVLSRMSQEEKFTWKTCANSSKVNSYLAWCVIWENEFLDQMSLQLKVS